MKTRYYNYLFMSLILLPAISKSQDQFNAIAVSDSIMVIDGSASITNGFFSGIARSTDHGNSWSYGIGGAYATKLLLDGSNVYACLTYGLYVSSDEGITWKSIGFDGWQVSDVLPDGATIFAVAGGYVFRSTDRGKDWDTLLTSAGSRGFYCVMQRAGIIYAGQTMLDNDGVFRSTDGGTTWSPFCLSKTIVNELCSSGNNILAGSTAPYGGILMSTDNGANWKEVLSYNQTIMVTGFEKTAHGIYASSRNGVFQSTDNGASWVPSGLAGIVVHGLSSNSTDIFADCRRWYLSLFVG